MDLGTVGGLAGLVTAAGGLITAVVLALQRRSEAASRQKTDASTVVHTTLSDALEMAEHRRQDIEALREERAALEVKIDQLEQSLQGALDRLSAAERELRLAREALVELPAMRQQLEALAAENEQLRAANQQLRADNMLLQEQRARWRSELATEKARTTQLLNRIRHLEDVVGRQEDDA